MSQNSQQNICPCSVEDRSSPDSEFSWWWAREVWESPTKVSKKAKSSVKSRANEWLICTTSKLTFNSDMLNIIECANDKITQLENVRNVWKSFFFFTILTRIHTLNSSSCRVKTARFDVLQQKRLFKYMRSWSVSIQLSPPFFSDVNRLEFVYFNFFTILE